MGGSEGKDEMKRLHARWNKLTADQRLYGRSYPIVALTGGVASGKSTVALFLKEQGVPIISADQLVKDIYSWQETREWLQSHYPAMISEDGIDFPKLRQMAFSDPTVKKTLEDYIYARLPKAFAEAEKKFPTIPWMVYEIPLLFERKMEHLFDAVVVAWVRSDIQKNRLLTRDPFTTSETADAILKSQMPPDEKKLKADLVFDNSGPQDENTLWALWEKLTVG